MTIYYIANIFHTTIIIYVLIYSYIPMLAESQLNPDEVSFTKNENRKTLFSGAIFIFLQPKQVIINMYNDWSFIKHLSDGCITVFYV